VVQALDVSSGGLFCMTSGPDWEIWFGTCGVLDMAKVAWVGSGGGGELGGDAGVEAGPLALVDAIPMRCFHLLFERASASRRVMMSGIDAVW
jgi:hypothetical protein